MKRRTAIAILLAIAGLVAVAALLYFLFWRAPKAEQPEIGGTFPHVPSATTTTPAGKETVISGGKKIFEPILRQLTQTPVAGSVSGVKNGMAVVHYIDRATGNAFEIPATGGSAVRLSITTIPKVYEALWNKSGSAVILRYLKEDGETIQTFSAVLKEGNAGGGELVGSFLPTDILQAAVSPDGGELFYLREQNSGTAGVRASFGGEKKTQIWQSPMREWLPLWTSPHSITLESRPSALADGMLLSIDRASGAERILLNGIRGLTALPDHAFSHILYSESTKDGVISRLFDARNKTNRALERATLAEKCVWTKNDRALLCGVPRDIPGGSYPDVWYQGVIAFDDQIWKIDPATGTGELVSNLASAAEPIDAVNLLLSPDEKFLIFMNKDDGTLWSLQLKE